MDQSSAKAVGHQLLERPRPVADAVLLSGTHLTEGHFVTVRLEHRIVAVALASPHRPDAASLDRALEDLVVTQPMRRNGIGAALLDHLVREAKSQDVKQVRWQVLDWNQPAIDFYESLGVEVDKKGEWLNCKLYEQHISQWGTTVR